MRALLSTLERRGRSGLRLRTTLRQPVYGTVPLAEHGHQDTYYLRGMVRITIQTPQTSGYLVLRPRARIRTTFKRIPEGKGSGT